MKKEDLIIDIGSNDGNLLSNFKNKHRVLGVTPELIGRLAIKRGINTLIKYFDNSTAKHILKKYGKAKLITATNVFAHIDDVDMKNILKILIKKEYLFQNLLFSFFNKTVQYDTIYHEHMRYLFPYQLNYLFRKYKLKIFYAKKISTHGGSIRVYVAEIMFLKHILLLKILKFEKNF